MRNNLNREYNFSNHPFEIKSVRMKNILIALLLMFSIISCVNNAALDQKVIEDSLRVATNRYLNQNTSSVKYHINYDVKNVSFFKESDIYLCEMKVHMKSDSMIKGKILDTEGVMKFRINEHFMILSRDY
jgi:hypothetical protein